MFYLKPEFRKMPAILSVAVEPEQDLYKNFKKIRSLSLNVCEKQASGTIIWTGLVV